MNILFADTAHPFLEQALTNAGHSCVYQEKLDRKLALEIMHQFDGVVIRSRFRFDKEMLDATNNLKFIARVGAGMENIDQEYAESLGIACLNAPEGNCNAVAEQALGMLLALFNNLMRADREVREGIQSFGSQSLRPDDQPIRPRFDPAPQGRRRGTQPAREPNLHSAQR